MADQLFVFGYEAGGVRRYMVRGGQFSLSADEAREIAVLDQTEALKCWIETLTDEYGAGPLITGKIRPFVEPAIEAYAHCVPGSN